MNAIQISYSTIDSPIGRLLLVGDRDALAGVYMESHKGGRRPGDAWRRDDALLRPVAQQLGAYFAGELIVFNLRLALAGTKFQRAVWNALCEIPLGQTVTYAQLAGRIGAAGAVRAVGAAVGRNPVSIIVPCHRVIGSDGTLRGFAGGLDRKRWLLEHEGVFLVGRNAGTLSRKAELACG